MIAFAHAPQAGSFLEPGPCLESGSSLEPGQPREAIPPGDPARSPEAGPTPGAPTPPGAGPYREAGSSPDPAPRSGAGAAVEGGVAGPGPVLEDLEDLGDEIARLAGHLHAATYRLLVLIRAFDEGEGWGGGFRSCAQWLSWRTGLAPGSAREKVRVARALGELPELSAGMARGELSYAKVRALTRVATPENEGELMEVARHATASQVERLVRAWRRVEGLEAEAEEERHRRRFVELRPEEDGSWVLRGRLDPEVGAVLRKALEWAGEALYRKGASSEVAEGVTAGQRRADALGLVAEGALATGAGAGAEAGGGGGEEVGRRRPPGRRERFQVVVHVEGGRGVLAEGGLGVSAGTVRRLACDAGVVEMRHGAEGEVVGVGRRKRTVSPALRRALEHRDGECRFPGCGCRYTEAHHIRHWVDGGETKLENLALLCRRHHRAIHEEGFGVEAGVPGPGAGAEIGDRGGTGEDGAGAEGRATAGRSGKAWGRGWGLRFYRPDGRLIPEVPPPPALPADPVRGLLEAHRALGIEPDRWTATPLWNGERLDYGLALDMLCHPLARERQAEGFRRRAGRKAARGGEQPVTRDEKAGEGVSATEPQAEESGPRPH